MANILEVILKGDAKHLNSSLSKASRSLKSFGGQVTDVGKNLSLKLSAPLALVGAKALSSAMNFQKLQTQLDVLTGSAEAGADAFERLVKFSAGTPFQLDELVKANNTLMGFGVSAEDAYNHLQAIGDIAAVSGGDLQGISVAFGQVAAAGRLMGQDLLQLINNGVPIIDMLSQSMGVAKSEIKDLVSEGAVTFPVLIEAFKQATGEGGKFEGGMQKLSQTLGGVLSTLKDNLNIAFAELGKEIVKAFDLTANMQSFINFIKDITERFKSLEPQTKKIVIAIGALAVALPPLLIILGSIISAVGTLTAAFGALNLVTGGVVLAIGALAAALGAVAKHQGLIDTIKDLNVELANNTKLAKDAAKANDGTAEAAIRLYKAERELLKTELKLKKAQQDKEQGMIANLLGIESEEYKKLSKEIAATELKIKNYDTAILGLENSLKSVGSQAKQTKVDLEEVGKVTLEDIQLKAQLEIEASQFKQEFNETTGALLSESESFSDIFNKKITEAFDPDLVPVMDEFFPELPEEDFAFLDDFNKKTEEFKNSMQSFGNIVGNQVAGSFSQLGDAIVSSMGLGEGAIANFTGAFLSAALDAVGAALSVAVSNAIASASAGSLLAGPAAPIILPALIAGTMAVVKGAFSSNVPKFANGGIVSAPTLGLMGEYAGAKSNPEVIAPLDRLKGMIGQRESNVNITGGFKLEGQDLVVALQRANRNRSRLL